jgi:hypothetical protein
MWKTFYDVLKKNSWKVIIKNIVLFCEYNVVG